MDPQPAPPTSASLRTALERLADLRFGMFNHFNLGTFTDEEWAAPGQDPALFAPTAVDCEQWADAAKAAGMTFGVLTTKHHDGFSLWPTAHGTQNVMHSGYRRDVVREYVDAFRSRGLRVGLYFSVWDRTHPVHGYGGYHVKDTTACVRPADTELVLGQVRELLTGYGEVDAFVTDGYAWQMGQQALPLQRLRELVRTLQPGCVMVDHGGLRQPFLGDAIYYEEPLGVTSPEGNTYASVQGQTISQGWFWHPSTPVEEPMALDDVLGHLADLEPKWTTFLLNCAPNRDGRLDDNVVDRLAEVGAAWSPDTSRGPLPVQPVDVEWPVTPVAAWASDHLPGAPARHAVDLYSDNKNQRLWSAPVVDDGADGGEGVSLTVDLGGLWSGISALAVLPQQFERDVESAGDGEGAGSTGDITGYAVSTSTDGVAFTEVASGAWEPGPVTKAAEWPATTAAFVRLAVTGAVGGTATVSNLKVGGRAERPERRGSAVDLTGVVQLDRPVRLAPAGDGFATLTDEATGERLEVAGLSREEGAAIGTGAAVDEYQQHWAVTPVDGGTVLLTNRFSGQVLAAGTDGGLVQAEQGTDPAQRWPHPV